MLEDLFINYVQLEDLVLSNKRCSNYYIRNYGRETLIPSIKSFWETKIQNIRWKLVGIIKKERKR